MMKIGMFFRTHMISGEIENHGGLLSLDLDQPCAFMQVKKA
jgi:hypothetical protein